jgi:hypothetical protein
VRVAPVLFEQIAVYLLNRCAGESVSMNQVTELASLSKVNLAVTHGPL